MKLTLTRIEPHELTTADIRYLLESVKVGNESWNDVLQEIIKGTATAWRVEADRVEGIILTQIVSGFLVVWHLAGKNFWKAYQSIIRETQDLVRRNGLKGIKGEAIPTLAKLYSRHGFTTPRIVVEWRA